MCQDVICRFEQALLLVDLIIGALDEHLRYLPQFDDADIQDHSGHRPRNMELLSLTIALYLDEDLFRDRLRSKMQLCALD